MNERIKELADQARQYARDHVADCKHYGYYMEHNEIEVKFEEKFAELIVRECVEVVKWTPSLYSNDEYVKNIKTHFGVE